MRSWSRKIFSLITLTICTVFTTVVHAGEGFIPNYDSNTFSIRKQEVGATAFLVRLPSIGLVLMTQVHVLDAVGKQAFLARGMQYGPRQSKVAKEENAFEFPFVQEALWQDDNLDVAILKAPPGLTDICGCQGYEIAELKVGERISLIGYPMQKSRVYPDVSKEAIRAGREASIIEQVVSVGATWIEMEKVVSDADCLSGNSGGPALNDLGQVVGIIHKMKTWYGIGYKYVSPASEITPIQVVLDRMKK